MKNTNNVVNDGEKVTEINPFIVDRPLGVIEHIITYVKEGRTRVVDANDFNTDPRYTKIYPENILNNILYTLPDIYTYKLLIYIITRLSIKADKIRIAKDVTSLLNIGETNYYKARKNLIDRRVILGTGSHNMYWVNPHYIFAGSRSDLIKKYEPLADKLNINISYKIAVKKRTIERIEREI